MPDLCGGEASVVGVAQKDTSHRPTSVCANEVEPRLESNIDVDGFVNGGRQDLLELNETGALLQRFLDRLAFRQFRANVKPAADRKKRQPE